MFSADGLYRSGRDAAVAGGVSRLRLASPGNNQVVRVIEADYTPII
jgi:hypothetical protein